MCDLDRPWRLVEDPAVLGVPGTDTERLARAGARRVVWAIARRSAAREAWGQVAADLAGTVVMEGSSIAAHAEPHLLLFVVHPRLEPARWKPGSAALIRRADAVILNRPGLGAAEPSAAVLEAVSRARGAGDVRIADVTRPLVEWAPDLVPRLDRGSRDEAGTSPPASAGPDRVLSVSSL